MNKTIKLTQSELTDLVKRVIKENVNSVSSDGYGMLNKNQQGDVTEDMAATSGSASNSFTSVVVLDKRLDRKELVSTLVLMV
jgi:hypothetical protein